MERAVICYLFDQRLPEKEIGYIRSEMKSLALTAGAAVIMEIVQKKAVPDKKYLIGKGKLLELKNMLNPLKIDLIIFYNKLSNSQLRNLERLLQIKIIDRVALILDIFALHARSMEGKLQIELAQLLYLLPRLSGKGIELSRLGGGIGTRGPGETKLETDRRIIKKRISIIKKRLEDLKKQRQQQRKSRTKDHLPVAALAGYTSAGKSTLFRTLSNENVRVSEELFSTLDPLLRRISLDEYQKGAFCLLSDTVGFIREIPQELLISFNATLEELLYADLIIHVIDLSSPDINNQKRVVENTLHQLGITENKIITVFNKIDLVAQEILLDYQSNFPEAFFISALQKIEINKLKKAIFEICFREYTHFKLQLPLHFNIINLQKWAIIDEISRKDDFLEVSIFTTKKKYNSFMENFFEKNIDFSDHY